VLASLAKLQAPGVAALLLERLGHDDVVIRAAAAAQLGDLRAPGAERALEAAYRLGVQDALPMARSAALDALAKYGAAALPVLREAFADRDWSVRLKAAGLVRTLDPAADVSAIRPAPTGHPADYYESGELVSPTVSPQVYIETDRGTIQLELAVLDAPLTCDQFVSLARRGFFNGLAWHRVVPNFVVQDGDPRGDGEGGSGRTVRDELNPRPYVRGTVGMALDGPDTGSSQYFITHSPQPHLDGRYTVFGRVVSGMAVVDQLQPGDPIRQVRVWDGKTMSQ
jgi:cyclophilin family peptidyl-prolyl cis-trans isomerase